MDIQKLTKEQAIIISGFTGILCGEFHDFHEDVEKRLGRGVQTFEFGIKSFVTEVKKLYEADFIELATVDKEPAKAQAVPECKWTQNEDGYFDASCGQSFVFSEPEDKPSKHKFTHCCFCGGKLVEAQEPTQP